ncbi:MAG TPA: ABC transporter permease [Gaiellaceae bacterium]|nr:ABC transporter permease [Gaiellaceae bacterium]
MRYFLHQLRLEQKVFWRNRESAIFIFIFPILLFLLLGSVYTGKIAVHGAGYKAASVLLTGMIGYGVANTAFSGIAIAVVIRREAGVLKRLRSTPLPPIAYLASVLASTLVVFVLQTVTLFAIGRLLFSTPLPALDQLVSLVFAVLLGVAAFAGMGLAAAALIRSSEGASAIVTVIVLPMAFLSGSFGSTRRYPAFLRVIGDVLPLKHFLDLLQWIFLAGDRFWQCPGAIAVVAAWGIVGAIVAVRYFGWEPRER